MGPEGERTRDTVVSLSLSPTDLFFPLLPRDGRVRDCKSPESCSWAETFNRIIRIGEISVLSVLDEGRLNEIDKKILKTSTIRVNI